MSSFPGPANEATLMQRSLQFPSSSWCAAPWPRSTRSQLTHSLQGRVTYLHHYLPTLWFAVIMAGNLLDHFVFKSRRFTERTKWIVFTLVAGSIVGTFWLFRACAWGIEGPASALVGRRWRKVSWFRAGDCLEWALMIWLGRGGTSWTRLLAACVGTRDPFSVCGRDRFAKKSSSRAKCERVDAGTLSPSRFCRG